MYLVLKLLLSIVLVNCNAIDDLLNKYANNTDLTNAIDLKNTLKEKIINSLNKSLDKLSNSSEFTNQLEQNKVILDTINKEIQQYNISNSLTDLEQIITSYELLNELNISEDTVKINKMLEGMKKIVNYLKQNKIDLRLPDLSNILNEEYFNDNKIDEHKPEMCSSDQCLLDGKCVNKIYCEKLAERNNNSNTTYYVIISILAFSMILFILYKIKYRVTNSQIEYIHQVKDEDGSISYT
jgi:hypothetical protein